MRACVYVYMYVCIYCTCSYVGMHVCMCPDDLSSCLLILQKKLQTFSDSEKCNPSFEELTRWFYGQKNKKEMYDRDSDNVLHKIFTC